MPPKVWDQFDIAILVAWLDFCIERGIDFQNDVIRLVRESRKQRTGHEYQFTIKQVEDKFIDLSRKDARSGFGRDPKDYPRLGEIYTRGSACFPRQANRFRTHIDLALEQFQANYLHSGPQEAVQCYRGENSPNVRDVHPEEESESPDQWIVKVSSTLKSMVNTVSVLEPDQFYFLEVVLIKGLANPKYCMQSFEKSPLSRPID